MRKLDGQTPVREGHAAVHVDAEVSILSAPGRQGALKASRDAVQ